MTSDRTAPLGEEDSTFDPVVHQNRRFWRRLTFKFACENRLRQGQGLDDKDWTRSPPADIAACNRADHSPVRQAEHFKHCVFRPWFEVLAVWVPGLVACKDLSP